MNARPTPARGTFPYPQAKVASFWEKVDVRAPSECWEWRGFRSPNGYGAFWFDGSSKGAHRFALIAGGTLIPDGFHVDHLCRNRGCVNPAHLEVVTPSTNTRRGLVAIRNRERADARTHCQNGHALDAANTLRDGFHRRLCRICTRATQRKNYHRRKAA